MSKLNSNHSRLTALSVLLFVASMTILCAFEACARQGQDSGADLKILDLRGYPLLRIDASGSVFDRIDNKVAVIDDRAGSLTLTKGHQKIVFKNDPAIQRDNDRYIVKFGDGIIFEVKPDGDILLDGKLWGRVSGYTQNDAQKNRFIAALVIIPFLGVNLDAPDGITLNMPRDLKNAEYDQAVRRESIVWIPRDDEIYVGDERIPKADFERGIPNKISELLKRQSGTNRLVYIAASADIDYGTVVDAISGMSASKERVQQLGLIVGDNFERFLLQIPALRELDEDPSKLKVNPLLLGVEISSDRRVSLSTGGYEGILMVGLIIQPQPRKVPKAKPSTGGTEGDLVSSKEMGTLNDTSSLAQTLAQIFQKRKEQHVYKPDMKTRTDLPEDERVEKTVVIKAWRSCRYADVIKIIDVVKGAGANPIVLQIDDLR
ncbi:MAG: hypothetical protein QOC96_1521 [Acidobacteriota bacterium]|jgi:biopolymer transport protein ExbD|nr:hypothetical protein [Acidobacteriota bacterium]